MATKKKAATAGTLALTHSSLSLDNLKKVRTLLRDYDHPLRLKMVEYIDANPGTNVTAIYKKMKIEQSVASQHLGFLRRSGAITVTTAGKERHYNVNHEAIKAIDTLVGHQNF